MKRSEQKELRREALLAGAITVLTEHGLEGFTTGRITAEAGIAQSGLYKHWPDREAVLHEVAELVGERILQAVRNARLQAGADITRIEESFAGSLRAVMEEREILMIFLRYRREPGPLGDVLRELLERALNELYIDLVNLGIVEAEAPSGKRLCYHVVAACLWTVEALLDGRFEDETQAATELANIAQNVLGNY
jgi:AcrR family transcriptional regulator